MATRGTAGGPAGHTLTVLRALVGGPVTMAQLAERTGLPLRAAYRWVEYLDAAGVPIRQVHGLPDRTGAVRYGLGYQIDAIDLIRWLTDPPPKLRRKRTP